MFSLFVLYFSIYCQTVFNDQIKSLIIKTAELSADGNSVSVSLQSAEEMRAFLCISLTYLCLSRS